MTIILATRNRHKAGEIGAILKVPVRTLSDLPEAPGLVENADTFAGNAAQKAGQLARWLIERPAALAGLSSGGVPGGRGTGTGLDPGKSRPMPSREAPLSTIVSAARQEPRPTEERLFRPPASAATRRGPFVLADDSGLEVDFLHGAPGVYSARFAAMDVSASGNSTDAENNAKLLRLLQGTPLEARTARFRCVLALIELTSASSTAAARLFEGACEGRISLQPSGAGGFGYDPLFVPDGFKESFAELGEEVKNRISHRARALAGLREWLTAR
jgi:non-canonical purine NTP pyrophosphatase (RdgB/HAM1 family)